MTICSVQPSVSFLFFKRSWMKRAVNVLLQSLKEYFLNLCDALKEVVAAGLMRTSGRTL